jgi:hypothetical protein
MKKENYLSFFYKNVMVMVFAVTFIGSFGLVSCSDSVIEKENQLSEIFENPAFSVNEDAVTYTSLDDKLKVLWQEGDKIGVFCLQTDPEALNERAVLHQAYVGQNRGVFRSEINWVEGQRHKFFVYYPWNKDAGTSAESLKHTIGQVQIQKGNNSMHIGKNAFMYARSNEVVPSSGDIAMDFSHTTCIFEISFKSDYPEVYGKPLTKVVLKADNDVVLSGDFTMDITAQYHVTANIPKFAAIDSGNASDSVILNLQDTYMPDNSTDSVNAYLVVNPAYMDHAIIHYTVGGEEYTLTKNVARQLKAQSVYKIMTKVDYSELSVTPQMIYLSPVTPTQTVTVQSTHDWVEEGVCAVASMSSTLDGHQAIFNRKTSQTDFSVYGNSIATIKTVGENPKYAQVKIANLYLSVPEVLYIGNPTGADTTVYLPDIVAYGGNAGYVVEGYTGDWIQSIEYHELSGKLKATVLRNNLSTDRPGTLTIHHVDDPDYKVIVPLLQNEFVYIPEFKFFVLDIDWCNRSSLDVDIAYLFEGNSPRTPFEDMPVGWGNIYEDLHLSKPSNWRSLYVGSHASDDQGLSVLYKTASNNMVNLINWGGDAVSGEGESVYFDAEAFYDATDVPRYLNMGLYLIWYAHPGINSGISMNVRVTLSCYTGGTMEKYSSNGRRKTNFRNIGGALVHRQSFFMKVSKIAQSPTTFKTVYTHAATIRYDRITHFGIMNETDPASPKWSTDTGSLCTSTNSAPISQEELKRLEDAKKKAYIQIYK